MAPAPDSGPVCLWFLVRLRPLLCTWEGKREESALPIPRTRCRSKLPIRKTEDDELLKDLSRGSQGAFDSLYQRYFQRIYNFAYLRLRNHADAEEVVQETFTAVFRCIDSYKGRSSLSSWIYGIAKNTINNHIRRLKTEEARVDRVETEGLRPAESLATGSPEEQLLLRRYLEAIGERLGAVAQWQVEVFELRHLANLSIQEISERTERSSDAIRSSLYRIKRMLVEAADGTPSVPDADQAWS
jgi:RNA polymerase sigma-70 factor (ECF subfamily)